MSLSSDDILGQINLIKSGGPDEVQMIKVQVMQEKYNSCWSYKMYFRR